MEVKGGVVKMKHHEQQELCRTRAPYRQGRKLTAVKVYTVNDESQHLLVCGVPQLQLAEDLKKLMMPYGSLKKVVRLKEYPAEEFTETFHVHFQRIQSARIAKRFIDGYNFFGGVLHVCYAPELETVMETRNKVLQRRKDIAVRIKRHRDDPTNPETDEYVPKEQFHRRKKYPTLPLTEERLGQQYRNDSLKTIYNGIPREIDPRPVSEPSLPVGWKPEGDETSSQFPPPPYNDSDALGRAVVQSQPEKSRKRNYRGRPVDEGIKVKVIRPQLVDTKKLVKFNEQEQKNLFTAAKKVNSGIKIKIFEKTDEGNNKRIVMKNPSVSNLVKPSEDLRSTKDSVRMKIRGALESMK